MHLSRLIGTSCISIGMVCIAIAAMLFLQNAFLEHTLKHTNAALVASILAQTPSTPPDNTPLVSPVFTPPTQSSEPTTITVASQSYAGVLTIPALKITLPVQNNWSYAKLKETPCVYLNEPFSIAAHNYAAHFGNLSKLAVGDTLSFTNGAGVAQTYTVAQLLCVPENSTEAVEESDYALTLFTCNFANDSERIVVHCNEIKIQTPNM